MNIEQLYKVSGISVIHGLKWIPLIVDDEEDKSELKQLIKEYDVDLMLKLQNRSGRNSDALYGFVSKNFLNEHIYPVKNYYSLSALLSGLCIKEIFPINCIFLLNIPKVIGKERKGFFKKSIQFLKDNLSKKEKQENIITQLTNEILVVVIKNGMPLSNGEFKGDKQEVLNYLNEFILNPKLFDIEEKTISRFQNEKIEDQKYSLYYGCIDAQNNDNLANLKEIAKNINDDYLLQKKFFRLEEYFIDFSLPDKNRAKLNKAKSFPKIISRLIILTLISSIGYGLYHFFGKNILDLFFKEQEIPKQVEIVDFNKVYIDNINRLLMSKGEYGGKLLIQLNKIFRPIPLELGGWKLKEVVCNKEICKGIFIPNKLYKEISTNETFLQATKPYTQNNNLYNIAFDLSGEKIEFNWKNIFQYQNQEKQYLVLERIPNIASFQALVFPFYQKLTRLGFKYKFNKLLPVEVQGINLKEIPNQYQVFSSNFILKGNGWQLRELPISDNMIIEEVKIEIAEDKTKQNIYELKGIYFIKN